MLINARLGLILLMPLLCAAPASGQHVSPQVQPGSAKIYLDVVIAPKSGQPVTGLQQQNFTLLDNKTPVAIDSFQAFRGNQAPIEVTLLVDAVNTDFQKVAYERDQIEKFLRANGGRLAYPTALAVFTDTGTKVQEGFSSDGNALSAALDQYTIGLRTINRSAGSYGAADRFNLSIGALHELAARLASRPGRNIILWVSPGWPLLSGPEVLLDSKQQQQLFADVVGLSAEFLQARITLYSIDPLGTADEGFRTFYYQDFLKGVTEPSKVQVGNLALQVLATQSGGLVLNSNNDIDALLQKCIADTEAYYELSFDPPPADQRDAYHQLEIRVAKPGLTVRTRQGYYTQPSPHN